ncbi:MAG: cupin domain-containing protein [Anaerolineae bacterium]|nr:cupin domain-containing protein [Anaerolineae bacterium]
MLIKAGDVPDTGLRKSYPIGGLQGILRHFAVRVTTPSNPFLPHRHDGEELWYIIDGEAVATVDGQEQPVAAGDLLILPSRVEHGLRATDRVTWICLG